MVHSMDVRCMYVWHLTWLLKYFLVGQPIKSQKPSQIMNSLADSKWWRSGCWCWCWWWWSVSERQCRDCGGGVYLCRPPKPVQVEKGIQEGYAGYTERYTGWRGENKQPMKGSFCFRNRTQQSHRRLWDLRSTSYIEGWETRTDPSLSSGKTESKERTHCVSNRAIWSWWGNDVKCSLIILHNIADRGCGAREDLNCKNFMFQLSVYCFFSSDIRLRGGEF